MWKLKKLSFNEVAERRQNDFDTVFEIKPLERGFGHTMGFALRRTMLGMLSSFSICGVRISDVEHEFQTIDGLIEDGVEFILALKGIKFTTGVEPTEEQKRETYCFRATMDPHAEVLRVSDFNFTSGFQAVDPDRVIARAASNLPDRATPLVVEIFVRYDKGFTDFQTNKHYYDKQIIKVQSQIQTGRFIAVDSDFSPVENVVFKVEELNSASSDIEECLTLHIKTDGRVSAGDALSNAARILSGSFGFGSDIQQIKDELFTEGQTRGDKPETIDDPVTRIGLSKRAENALKSENIHTVQALIDYGDLEMIENIGKKTAQEIRDKLRDYLNRRQMLGSEDLIHNLYEEEGSYDDSQLGFSSEEEDNDEDNVELEELFDDSDDESYDEDEE